MEQNKCFFLLSLPSLPLPCTTPTSPVLRRFRQVSPLDQRAEDARRGLGLCQGLQGTAALGESGTLTQTTTLGMLIKLFTYQYPDYT